MKYSHRFRVRAPLAAVVAFHQRATSMAAITPPPAVVRLHQTPAVLREGDTMAFTLWLGPLPVPWTAHIEEVSPTGFVDRQVRGPFADWRHRHSYVAITPAVTEVVDEIEATLRAHVWWGPIGLGMWMTLPLLFAYRAWKTRQLLEQ